MAPKVSRRGFLAGLAALAAGLVFDPVTGLWVKPEPRVFQVLAKLERPELVLPKPRRVVFPLFKIATSPEIPLSQIKERRFDLIERATALAAAQIRAAEDERVLAILASI